MNKNLIILLVLTVFNAPVWACEPCSETYTLEESVNYADLIIIGKKTGKEGRRTDDGEGWGGPDWIEVDVLKEIKGTASGRTIKVNSWDGMCNYGIILKDDDQHIIFLTNSTTPVYNAVLDGCGYKSLSLIDPKIVIENTEFSHDQLIEKIKSIIQEKSERP